MLNLGQLVNTVQKNCHISDARHAGDFTLCIFLLKMMEHNHVLKLASPRNDPIALQA